MGLRRLCLVQSMECLIESYCVMKNTKLTFSRASATRYKILGPSQKSVSQTRATVVAGKKPMKRLANHAVDSAARE